MMKYLNQEAKLDEVAVEGFAGVID